MIILHLPHFVFNFSVKLSSFGLALIKGQNYFAPFSTVYSFFQENINANLTFAVIHLFIILCHQSKSNKGQVKVTSYKEIM